MEVRHVYSRARKRRPAIEGSWRAKSLPPRRAWARAFLHNLVKVARGLQGISTARTCEEDEGWPAGSAAFGAGGDLRWGDPYRGGEDWRRDAADHPGLGDAV